MKKNIYIIDDHPMVINGIEKLISTLPDFEIVGSSISPIDIIDRIPSVNPDILIFDYQLPNITGIEIFNLLRASVQTLVGICYTQHSEAWIIQQLIKSKVAGVIIKSEDPQFLIEAVLSVSIGKRYYSPLVNKLVCHSLVHEINYKLTGREIEILKFVATGLSAKETANQLNLSVNTIEDYRKNLMAKLNVRNVAELVHKATKMGYV